MMDVIKILLLLVLGVFGLLLMGYFLRMCERTSNEDWKLPKWIDWVMQFAILACMVYSIVSFGLWLDSVLHFVR